MTIAERLAAVRDRIDAAARTAGRAPDDVELMVVTKRRTAHEVREAVAAGARLLGENYVQEAQAKRRELADLPDDVRWHLIGPVQTNKAKVIPGTFDAVESVDRPALIGALARRATAADRVLPVVLQVNVGREPQKAGCAPEEVGALCDAVREAPSLALAGLMAIPPAARTPEAARPHFRALAAIARDLVAEGRLAAHPTLSMGMSGDYEVAIAEGATRVRIGTAIFGPRA